MSMQPLLRFKTNGYGFKTWEKTLLSQIATVTMGQSPNSDAYNDDYDGLPLIQGNADIVDGFTKPSRYTTEITKRCQKNDVILSVRAPVGELGIATEECCIGRGVCAIRANDKSETAFIYQLLQAKKKQWKTLEQGSTFTAVSGEDVKAFEVVVPTKEEQQKIAAFFTALDEKIRLSQQKLTLFSKIKNGITKKILSQEVRFNNTDGSFFKQWKSYTVGELAEVIGGGTPSTQNSDYWDGDIYWLTPAEINSKFVHSSNRKITVSGLNNSSAKLLPKGALLLTTRATLGACSINNQDNPVCTNQGFQSLVCNDFVDNEFMYYVVTANEFQKAMVQRASGSTFIEISSKNLKAISVNLPSLEEQRQIATLLSYLDEKIECLKQRVEVLKTQKASFMQQIFI